MWFFYAFLAAICWGVGQVVVKHGFSNVSPLLTNLLSTIFALLLYIPFALFHGINLSQFWQIFPWVLITGSAYCIYYYVISKGQIALTGTILATYPLATIILSALFLHEQTSVMQKIASLAIILGAVILAMPTNKKLLQQFRFDDWVWWGVAGAAIIGSADFGAKVMIGRSDAYTYLFALALAFIPITGFFFIIDKKGRTLPRFRWKSLLPTIIGAFLIELGIIPFNVALQYGLASLVGPVSSSFLIISAILAYFFLHERITKTQVVGIGLSALGVIALGFS